MNIRSLRERNDWTQEQMAEHIGVSARTIRRWESDMQPPILSRRIYEAVFAQHVQQEQPPQSNQMTKPIPISDVIDQRPEMLKVEGPLAPLLGRLPLDRPFSILLGGASGGGKSSAALLLAQLFAKHGLVLYCTSEERIDSGTIGIRAQQLGIDDDNIDVVEISTLEDMREHLGEYDYSICVVDSINELDVTPQDVIDLMRDNPDTSWILVAQADATEKSTVGGARWRHLVDIRLWCEVDKDGVRVVRNLKNRFAPTATEIRLSAGQHVPIRKKRPHPTSQETNSQPEEDKMSDYHDWIIRRLESDLAQARAEASELRSKLENRDETIRSLELRVARYELEHEITEGSQQSSLSDKLTPDSLSRMAEKFAPIATVVSDIIRTMRPAEQMAVMQAPEYSVPVQISMASPFAPPVTTPFDALNQQEADR
jgi:DNA-binding XRE family transcriptional regulator